VVKRKRIVNFVRGKRQKKLCPAEKIN